MADDEFDKFLEGMDNDSNDAHDSTVNTTVIPNPAANLDISTNDELIEDVDQFLQSLDETTEQRQEMFNEESPKTSTPKFLKKLSRMKNTISSPLAAGSPKITANESIRALSPEAKRCKRETSSDEAAQNNDIIEKVNKYLDKTGDRSQILAGNIVSGSRDDDAEFDDDLLLQDDDFDEGYAKELTIDDLIEMDELLESDEEEEDEDEITIIGEVAPKPDQPKDDKSGNVAAVAPIVPKVQRKTTYIDKNKLNHLKNDYYEELGKVYQLYLKQPPPPISEVSVPRIFKDNNKKDIIGYEKIDEYLDNNHPMWIDDRKMFSEFLHSGQGVSKRVGPEQLAKYLHKKWNSGYTIDLCQNLSSIPRIKYVERDQECVYIMPDHQIEKNTYSTGIKMNDFIKEASETIKNQTFSNNEEWRREEFESRKENDRRDEASRSNCSICSYFCLCGIQKESRKRKWSGENERENDNRITRREEIIQIIYNQNKRLRIDEIARIVKCADDVMDFNVCYTGKYTLGKQMLQDLSSLEVVYKGFDYYYSSPYAKHQKPKSNPSSKKGDSSKQSNTKASTPASSSKEVSNGGAKVVIDIIEEY